MNTKFCVNKAVLALIIAFPLFSLTGHSPGRAIVLPPVLVLALVAASALAKC